MKDVVSHIVAKIRRLVLRLRLRPIRVFCLHQVCEEYDSLRCFECDWTPIDSFMRSVDSLLESYVFISLTDAQKKLSSDFFRVKRYAVLTFDDGYRSSLSALRWLDSKHIPYVLFLNGKYLDGYSFSRQLFDNARLQKPEITEKDFVENLYLTREDIHGLSGQIGSHGYEHVDATNLDESEFSSLIQKNVDAIKDSRIPMISFHAYTWGRHSEATDNVLSRIGFTPVLMDGEKNYNDSKRIHRELFPMD